MGDIVNLRQARKAKSRADAQAAAAENRAKHGRTKAEKTLAKFESGKAQTHLDSHRRDKPE